MSRRKRARTSIDFGKISAAVARPGIDPRTWLTYALVDEVGFDENNGMFADVTYIPTREEQTCLVGAAYAGNGFGLWAPLEVDDVVLVALPNGDSNSGPVIIARLWNAADKPPSELGSGEVPTENVVCRVQAGKRLRFITSGGGNAEIVAEGDGKVLLGSDSATRGAARQDDEVDMGYFYIYRDGDKDRLYWRAPGTNPLTPGVWAEIDSGVTAPIVGTVGTALTGSIKTSSGKVKVSDE